MDVQDGTRATELLRSIAGRQMNQFQVVRENSWLRPAPWTALQQ